MKRIKTYVKIESYTQIFIAMFFILAKESRQLKCPLTDEWINKMWYVHTMGYYSAIKRNGVLIHGTMWMNLQTILLSERSQSQRTKYSMIPE